MGDEMWDAVAQVASELKHTDHEQAAVLTRLLEMHRQCGASQHALLHTRRPLLTACAVCCVLCAVSCQLLPVRRSSEHTLGSSLS